MKLKGLTIIGYFSFTTKEIYQTIDECKLATIDAKNKIKAIKQNTNELINWVKDSLKSVFKMKPSFKRWATIGAYKAIIKDLKFTDYHEFINLC